MNILDEMSMQSNQTNAMTEEDKEMHRYITTQYEAYKQTVKNQTDIQKIQRTAFAISLCLKEVMSVLYNDKKYNSILKTHISNKNNKTFEGENANDIRKNMTLIYIYRHELHLLQLKNISPQNGGFFRQLRYNTRYRNLKTKDNDKISGDYQEILNNMNHDNTKSEHKFLNDLLKVKNIREIYYIIIKLIDEIIKENNDIVYIYCAKLIISLYIFQLNLYNKYEKKHTDGKFLNKIDANTIRNYEYTDKFLYDKINEKKPATEVQQPSSSIYPSINTSMHNISERQLVRVPSSVSPSSSLHSSFTQIPSLQSSASSTSSSRSTQSHQPSSTQSSISSILSADSSNTSYTDNYSKIEARPFQNRTQTPIVLHVKPVQHKQKKEKQY